MEENSEHYAGRSDVSGAARVLVGPTIDIPGRHRVWRLGGELDTEEFIQRLLDRAIDDGATCIHIKASSFPTFRVDGVLTPAGDERLEASDVERIAGTLLGLAGLPVEGSLRTEEEFRLTWNGSHFRVASYQQSGTLALVVHCVLSRCPSLGELGISADYAVPTEARGIYLVGGPRRRELMAALVERHNQTASEHIIALRERPRYRYLEARSMISQIEVGVDCSSFEVGLEAACRLAPDWLVVGRLTAGIAGEIVEVASSGSCMVVLAVPPEAPADALRWFCDRCPDPTLARSELARCLQGVLTLGPGGPQHLDSDSARAIAWRRTPQGVRG